jgi:hypothetical protein
MSNIDLTPETKKAINDAIDQAFFKMGFGWFEYFSLV